VRPSDWATELLPAGESGSAETGCTCRRGVEAVTLLVDMVITLSVSLKWTGAQAIDRKALGALVVAYLQVRGPCSIGSKILTTTWNSCTYLLPSTVYI
jgi:hypothetical protein